MVAYTERELPRGDVPAYLSARGSGACSFVPWTDEHRRARMATLVPLTAAVGVATFRCSARTRGHGLPAMLDGSPSVKPS